MTISWTMFAQKKKHFANGIFSRNVSRDTDADRLQYVCQAWSGHCDADIESHQKHRIKSLFNVQPMDLQLRWGGKKWPVLRNESSDRCQVKEDPTRWLLLSLAGWSARSCKNDTHLDVLYTQKCKSSVFWINSFWDFFFFYVHNRTPKKPVASG